MLVRAAASRRVLSVAASSLVLAQRPLMSGMTSNRIPRGMAPLAVRESEQVIEELADAYVNMDLATMTTFHKKAMTELWRGSGGAATSTQYEEQLLQAMGGGGGAAMAAGTPAPAAATSAGSAAGAEAASAAAPPSKKAAEKTAFDITLKKYPAESKIKLIKELRSACGLGIQEAKMAIEKCPGVIAQHLPAADAEKLKATMSKLGAEVELT
jgi:large subunit ribosomal protein L7/L12